MALKAFCQRSKKEKNKSPSLKHAEKIKLELEDAQKRREETLTEASLEAKNVSGAKEQAKSSEAQKEDARNQAEEIISKARESMAIEKEQILNEAKEEISSSSSLLPEKFCKELNDEEKSRFSNAAAEELKVSD